MKNRNIFLILWCVLLLFGAVAVGDWDESMPFKMHWPQLPDPDGLDVCLCHQYIADDFECTETGTIDDIHFWISWKFDLEGPPPEAFPEDWDVSIWEDAGGFPGNQVWSLSPGAVINTRYYGSGDQGWLCPSSGFAPIQPDHQEFFQVNITQIEDPMVQVEGTVYWLVIKANFPTDPQCTPAPPGNPTVGWKTADLFSQYNPQPGSFFGSPALWSPDPFSGDWRTPQFEAYDQAFVITGEPIQQDDLDYGDAPDPAYQTLRASDGARHYPFGPWLGDASDAPDAEPDGQPHAMAKGDDGSGIDDENGVNFLPPLVTGQNASVSFQVSGADANVDGWVDFNSDGVWDPSEQIVAGIWPIGTHTVPFTVPAGSTVGTTFARFRISTDPAIDNTPTGLAQDGEVEDHPVVIEEPEPELDFGDAPDPFAGAAGEYPTLLANDGARHYPVGPWLGDQSDNPDPELDGQQDPMALGDDNDGNDDEDGVSFSILLQGQLATVTFEVNGAGGVGGPGADVIGWVDFNADGKWDPSEKIVGGTFFDGPQSVPFSVPPGAAVGPTFARFRISTDAAAIAGPIGLAQDGEVEDHWVWIEEVPPFDVKWEQLPDLGLSGLHAHDYSDPSGSNYTQIIYADDWVCEGGVVTDFHWWGFEEAPGAGLAGFHVSIHANDPTSCLPLDPPLWQKDVPLSDITVTWMGSYYRYDYYLQPEDYFYQIEGETYWFDLSALSVDPGEACLWIWAEHGFSVLCPAAVKVFPTQLDWQTDGSSMAFRVTSDSSIELMDFGDAPDQPYPTLLVNNGARHFIGGPWLGDAADMPDAEGNGQQDPSALGDDINGYDDEDGVWNLLMNQGVPSFVSIEVNGGGGFVDAWIDWDGSGSWDASEQIHNAHLPDGIHHIPVTPPVTGIVGQTFARFRINSAGNLPPYGPAADGEVEDHVVDIEDGPLSDLGDAPDSSNSTPYSPVMFAYSDGTPADYPTVFSAGSPPHGPKHWSAFTAVWLGPNVTLEDEANTGLDQDGINNIDPSNNVADLDGADDGLFLPVSMPRCKWTNVGYEVNVADTTQIYYVNIWCDFNRDGDWDDQVAGCPLGDVPEWAVRNQMLVGLPAGLNTVTSLPFVSWHPVDGLEELWVRITISEQPWQEIWGSGGCGPVNGYAVGETEDYLLVPDTSCSECADLDCSGFVDLADFAIFAQQWLSTCP